MDEKQFLETWDIHNRINLYLLEATEPAALSSLSASKGRTVGEQFAHLHNVRLMWLKAAAPDLLAGLTKVLSGLRRREAIFVGQAAMLPSRILVSNLEEGKLPRSHDISFNQGWQCEPLTPQRLSEVSERWRNQERHSGNTTNPTPA